MLKIFVNSGIAYLILIVFYAHKPRNATQSIVNIQVLQILTELVTKFFLNNMTKFTIFCRLSNSKRPKKNTKFSSAKFKIV